jgi:hypothetical protein
MLKAIVTTTINPITEAVQRFQTFKEWELIVVGDKKTPTGYRLDRGTYLSPEIQEKYDRELSDIHGWNCIERRNFGLLWAHDMGADIVAIVDDDNIPYDNWGKDLLIDSTTEVTFFETELPAFDPIGATNERKLWHRGYPLQLISKRDYTHKQKKLLSDIEIQADFWNGDPDIDAVCRMEHAPECAFDEACFPFAAEKISPFNSQNTFIKGTLLKDYFLFPDIGRQHDIWASYYLGAKGHRVVYNKPSVYSKRNEHDITKDMEQEIFSYVHGYNLVKDLALDPEKMFDYLSSRAIHAFELYKRHFE